MAALSLQYTAYKEMLLGFAGDTTMNVNGINQHGTGNGAEIIFAEPFPHRASEAYLFSPPGYWKDVYNNPLYPDDFPTDLKSSMSGGATTATIPGSYTDGHYLMLYNVWEVWRKVEVDIVDGKVHYVHDRDVSNLPENIDYMFGEDDGFWVDIDVNSAMMSEIDSEINIAVVDGNEIDGEIFVTIAGEDDLYAEIFVWNKAQNDLDSEIWVKASEELDSEITVKYDCITDIDSEITVKILQDASIDTEMFVWYVDHTEIDAELLVTHNIELYCEITVKRYDLAEIDSVINIQRVDQSEIDSSIHVFSPGVGPRLFLDTEITVVRNDQTEIESDVYFVAYDIQELDSEIEIERLDETSNVDTDIIVVQKAVLDIDTEVNVVSNIFMEAEVDTEPQQRSLLDSEIMIISTGILNMPTELFVSPQPNAMEAVVNMASNGNAILDSEIYIVETDRSEIDCELSVSSATVMEALADTWGSERNDIEAELTVVRNGMAAIDSVISVSTGTLMEAITDIKGGDQSDLDSELIVVNFGRVDLDAEIAIISLTNMEVAAQRIVANGYSDIDNEMIIVDAGSADLDSEITITAIAMMEAVTGIKGGGQADIDCEIFPAFLNRSTIDCEMMVNATNQMNAAVFYRNDVYADLDSEIAIAVNADLNSEIYVVYEDDKTVMEVSAHTMPAVLRTSTTTAIKDAVCYSYTALTNYGTLPEFSVGRFTGGETFKGLIGFNLAELNIPHTDAMNYFGYEIIQKAILKLYVTRPMVEDDVIIKVYRISDSWFETKVNYRALDSLPVYEQVAELVAPKKMGDIAIDITAGFTDWAHKSDRQSFIMVVENPLQATKKGIYFSSREGFKVPRLEVQYYRTLLNGYWNDLDSEVFVNPNANLDSEITIAAPNETAIPCFIDIAMAGSATCDLEIDIEILANNIWSELLDSEIEIIGYPDEAQLDSECFIMFWEEKATLDAELIVVRDPQGEAYMYIM